jgi:branched-chain amino acid transport system permease protein
MTSPSKLRSADRDTAAAATTFAASSAWRRMRRPGGVIGESRVLPGWLACCLVVAALIAVFSNTTLLSPFSTAAAYVVIVVGLDVALGLGGMLALGQGALWGVSSYTFAILTTGHEWGFWPAAIAAECSVAILGAVLIPLLRLRGLYFALATLVLGLIFAGVVNALVSLTGGPTGMSVFTTYHIGGFAANTVLAQCVSGWVIAMLVVGLVLRMRRSRFGVGLQAARDDELAAASFGVNVLQSRAKAWMAAALLSGISGVMFCVATGYLTPDEFSLQPSVLLILMLVLGGEGSVYGALIGASVITLLPNVFSSVQQYSALIYACVVLVVIVVLPEGLFGLGARCGGLVARFAAGQTQPGPQQHGAHTEVRPPLHSAPLPAPEAKNRHDVAIAAHEVSKRFGGVAALDGVSFEVRTGEIFGIIGPNGAGKTTLLNCLSGLNRPDEGAVHVSGVSIERLRPDQIAGLGLARTFQNVRIFGRATVRSNTRTGVYSAGRSGLLAGILGLPSARRDLHEMRSHADAALELVGLTSLADQPASNLTTGQQRIAEVARCVASGPDIVLLDEPAAGLAESEVEHLREVIHELRRRGQTVVLIEHNMDFVMGLCDRLLVLDLGRPIALGTPAEIRVDPAVIDAYLGG